METRVTPISDRALHLDVYTCPCDLCVRVPVRLLVSVTRDDAIPNFETYGPFSDNIRTRIAQFARIICINFSASYEAAFSSHD